MSSCGTCMWWTDVWERSTEKGIGGRQGVCCRHAPRPITMPLGRPHNVYDGEGDVSWPLTHADDRCGEWSRKRQSEVEHE